MSLPSSLPPVPLVELVAPVVPVAVPAPVRPAVPVAPSGLTGEVIEVVSEPDRSEPVLEIDVKGSPSFSLSMSGGSNADDAVAALAVNAIPRVLMADPGLYTIAELPPVHCWTSLGLLPAPDDEDDFDDDE